MNPVSQPNASLRNRDSVEAPIVSGRFEIGERLKSKLVVKSSGEAPSDSRDRRQERHGIGFPAQAVEQGSRPCTSNSRIARAMVSPTPRSSMRPSSPFSRKRTSTGIGAVRNVVAARR
jgi:hypothetical protein